MRVLLERPWAAPMLILAAGAGALVFAFTAQYGFGLEPCVLCLYQRWPFAAAIPLGALGLALSASGRSTAWVLVLAGLAFAVNAGIAAYHVGIEQHWWQGSLACTGPAGGAATLDQLRAQLMATPVVRCDEVAWRFLGLSMAGWNVPFSAALAAFCFISLRARKR